jgi:glycosyltransferase involved in cell wall biosynthesis
MRVKIYCICSAVGYPFGTATSKRITMIGKILTTTQFEFQVLHYGTSPYDGNNEARGVYENISFRYFSLIKRPNNKIFKNILHLFGIIALSWYLVLRSFRSRENKIVYLYTYEPFINIYFCILSRILRYKVIQEINEWCTERDTKLTYWFFNKPLVKLSNGAIVISHAIQEEVKKIASKRKYSIFYLPIVNEINRDFSKTTLKMNTIPHIFWCGMVDGYIKDVLFQLKLISLLKVKYNINLRFVIAGRVSNKTIGFIRDEMTNLKLTDDDISILGFVDNSMLNEYMQSAFCFILPLWNDVKSTTRFPNKISEYLLTGRPLITCRVGEVQYYLEHAKSVLYYEPENLFDLADKINLLYNEPELKLKIGENGKDVAMKHFTIDKYVMELNTYIKQLSEDKI